MRKKCVRLAKLVLATLFASAVTVAPWSIAPLQAQSADPTTQPRLSAADLTYIGGFRVPAQTVNGDHFQFGGRQLTFNPANNSLIIGSRAGRVAEVSIPAAINTSNPNAMNFASYLQAFWDPTEGHLKDILTDGVNLDGLLVINDRLIGTASVFYDADNLQRISHYSRSLRLDEQSFSGWSAVWDAPKTGFVSGQMSVVPPEWRSLLGGDAITGQCCIPIVTRTSWGPSAFSFNPSQIGQPLVPASPLLYYTKDHATLGRWEDQNPTYGQLTFMGGVAIIAQTRTVLFFGRNGMGESCYGNGTSDPSLHGTMAPDGAHYCYDPTSSDKGGHAYPYRYQIWAYDLNDFVAVKNGVKQPWEVTPYGVWPLELPTPETTMRLGGVGYDPVNQLLYVSQMYADTDGYASRPLVHVIQINAAASNGDGYGGTVGTPPPPPSTTTPPADSTTTPPPSTTPSAPPAQTTVVKSISLAVDRNAPQVAGTAIKFTASVVGGIMPHEYKWLVFDGAAWQIAMDWSTSEVFTWIPAVAGVKYRVGVWARSNGNTTDEAEASVSTPFAIMAAPAPAPVAVRAVTFASDKPAPQPAGTAITFTATVDGGVAVEYKWLLHDGNAWGPATEWSSQPTFVWTPAAANAYARIGLWVRSNGNTRDEGEMTWSADYPVSAGTAPAPTPDPAPAPAPTPLRGVTFSADKPAPQAAGTAITFTATPDGGTAVEYKWLVHDGLNWNAVTGWSPTNAFVWTPGTANAYSRVGLWVRSNGNTSDQPEASFSTDYAVTAGAVAAPAVPGAPVESEPAPAPAPITEPVPAPPAPPAGPAVTLASTTVVAGGSVQFTVSGGPGNATDWVSLSPVSAADNGYTKWIYLNGLNAAPATGMREATLQFTAPLTAGTYNIRFFAKDGFTKLATSATITVGNPTAAPAAPAVAIASATVKAGQAIQFTVSDGPANLRDWVALTPAAAADTGYVSWVYLNGMKTAPASGYKSATLQLAAPATPGTYNIRFFANDGFTKLATSATVTVTP